VTHIITPFEWRHHAGPEYPSLTIYHRKTAVIIPRQSPGRRTEREGKEGHSDHSSKDHGGGRGREIIVGGSGKGMNTAIVGATTTTLKGVTHPFELPFE